jgi:hypothetical protein
MYVTNHQGLKMLNQTDIYQSISDFLSLHSLIDDLASWKSSPNHMIYDAVWVKIDDVLDQDDDPMLSGGENMFDRACLHGLRDWMVCNPDEAVREARQWGITVQREASGTDHIEIIENSVVAAMMSNVEDEGRPRAILEAVTEVLESFGYKSFNNFVSD